MAIVDAIMGPARKGQPRTSTEKENIDQVDWYRKVHLKCIITNYDFKPGLLDLMVSSLVSQVQHTFKNHTRTYTHTMTHAPW